jgi:hypothetical protein
VSTHRTLRRAVEALTARLARARSHGFEGVEARALEGNDWGAEAQPKRTEFETRKAARAMTCSEFDRVV